MSTLHNRYANSSLNAAFVAVVVSVSLLHVFGYQFRYAKFPVFSYINPNSSSVQPQITTSAAVGYRVLPVEAVNCAPHHGGLYMYVRCGVPRMSVMLFKGSLSTNEIFMLYKLPKVLLKI